MQRYKSFPKNRPLHLVFSMVKGGKETKKPRGAEGKHQKSVLSFCPAGGCPQIGQRLENEGAQEVVAHDASEIADEGCPRDVASVPSKADLLQTHRHYAGGAADDQYRSAHARTIGQKLPEHAVDGKGSRLLQGVHADATSHERHVVHDAGEHADEARHQVVVAMEGMVEALSHDRQHAHLLQAGHRHQDAEEEEDGAHIDAAQQLADPLAHVACCLGPFRQAEEQLRHRPKNGKNKQNAHKRGQVGEVAEDGHEDETTHAEQEDRLVLPSREHAGSSLFRRCVGFHQCSVKLILEEEGGDEDGDGRGNEQLLDDTCCRDASHVPQHDGRHVADGREGAARIGRQDDERGIDDAVAMVADQFAEHHDHDDRRGHVVEDGRQDERQCHHAPEQSSFRLRLQRVADEVEATILIDHLHDGHGSHEEEERRGDAAQVLLNDGVDA